MNKMVVRGMVNNSRRSTDRAHCLTPPGIHASKPTPGNKTCLICSERVRLLKDVLSPVLCAAFRCPGREVETEGGWLDCVDWV